MHEAIVLEKRPSAAEGNTSTFEDPPSRNTRTEICVSLIHEEIKKEPYVKEEIVIKKKPRTEAKTLSEFVISKKVVDTSNPSTAQAS